MARSLQIGCSGDDVRKLQQQLKSIGYYTGLVDGDFGSITDDAVKKFQRANGLVVDGVYGPKTSAVLNAKLKAKSSNTRICLQCGLLFPESKKGRHKNFCSNQCRFAYWNERKKDIKTIHICANCGKTFISKGNPNKRYCSRKCYCEKVKEHEG